MELVIKILKIVVLILLLLFILGKIIEFFTRKKYEILITDYLTKDVIFDWYEKFLREEKPEYKFIIFDEENSPVTIPKKKDYKAKFQCVVEGETIKAGRIIYYKEIDNTLQYLNFSSLKPIYFEPYAYQKILKEKFQEVFK